MDAVKFLRDYHRMCNEISSSDEKCYACPLHGGCDLTSLDIDVVKVVSLVEQWSKEHPRKTLKDGILEKYPSAELGEDGSPYCICPKHFGDKINCSSCDWICNACCNQPFGIVYDKDRFE